MAEPKDDRVFVYRIDNSDVLTEFNSPWRAFAIENGASSLPDRVIGRPLWEFIADNQVRQLYRDLLAWVRQERRLAHITYRCDSPETRRFMEMSIVPLDAGMVEFRSRVLRLDGRSRRHVLSQKKP